MYTPPMSCLMNNPIETAWSKIKAEFQKKQLEDKTGVKLGSDGPVVLWWWVWFLRIFKRRSAYDAVTAQCSYGLQSPGAQPCTFCRELTRVLANFPPIEGLTSPCLGKGIAHRHEVAWGSRIVDGHSIELSEAAGRYPLALYSR